MTQPCATDASAAKQAILDLLERLNQGFARQEVKEVLKLFAPDPEITFIGSEAGETAAGPAQLRNLLEALFARPETYRWHWGELHINTNGQTAWLVTQAVLLVEGPEPVELPYRITLVLQRHGSSWRIMHYHGSEPVAVP
jgi:ketosteroid isomerase-like protein